MTWNEIKFSLGKQLGDPDLVKYGGLLKDLFRDAYLRYIVKHPTEQNNLQQALTQIGLTEDVGSYTIPKSLIFINVSAVPMSADPKYKRYTEVEPEAFAIAFSNSISHPSSREVLWFRDSNTINFMSNNTTLKFRLNYFPELNFGDIDGKISNSALASIIRNIVYSLTPKEASNERTDTD